MLQYMKYLGTGVLERRAHLVAAVAAALAVLPRGQDDLPGGDQLDL